MLKPSLLAAAALVCLAVPVAAQNPQNQPPQLPAGEGKALTEAVCTACHNVNLITGSSGYTRDEWLFLMKTMVTLPGTPEARVADYLAVHFPPNTKRAPTMPPGSGDASVKFTMYQVPTPGSRSRDPFEAADGSIWWAGQYGNTVGRLDPATGAMKEFALPSMARPHSIVEDKFGNVWYTGNANGTVGKLDPKTGKITAYPMPDPAARDPHTPIFDLKGNLWFSIQQSNMVGRLAPDTGEIKLFMMDRPRSLPYGMQLDSKGTVWTNFYGTNGFASFNPDTLEKREYYLPNEATRARRHVIAPDDTLWYVDSARGYIGQFNPTTNQTKEWASPSGGQSHPYAIAFVDGIVWYNESGQRPDALVSFDPKTEKFLSWPIPSGQVFAGIIRNMKVTKDGKLLIHQSSTNHIGIVDISATKRGTTN
jgi:virginiamycin B lyase